MSPQRPPQRTVTRSQSIFARTGSEAVIYDLSKPDQVTITIPPSSQWTSGPHWHEKHKEYLQVVQGKALITLDQSTWIHCHDDGIIEVKQGQVHEWRRPEEDSPAALSENLIVREWTDPSDGQKEVFFRMLNSYLMESKPHTLHDLRAIPLLNRLLERYVIPLQLFVIFAAYDNWPVILGQGVLGWMITHSALWLATTFGAVLLGLQSTYDEYVSRDLQDRTMMRSKKSQ